MIALIRRHWPLAAGVPLLLWPALLNGYPIVFSDTGTYLSQAIHRYAGWDRPVFYSVFMYGLHLTLTTWPVVLAQAVAAVWMLDRARAVFFPAVPRAWLAAVLAVLCLVTGMPWLASRLMPDLFTPLLVLAVAMLVLVPERLGRWDRLAVFVAALGMTLLHQSHVPLLLGLLALLAPCRRWLGARARLGRAGVVRLVALPGLALLLLSGANLAAHGRFSPSPFGNVFLLARVLADGPGLRALERDCPRAGWKLCGYLGEFPATADDFLWRLDSPLNRAGGAKAIAGEAGEIILSALLAEPWAQARALAGNTWRQLQRFSPGDGLHPWEATVSPWIARDFPAFERRSYAGARQERGELALPAWTAAADRAAGLLGLMGVAALLWREARLRTPRAGLAAAVLLAVLGNAAITGGISGPHDRYQSRVMWLPVAVVLLAAPSAGGRLLRRAGSAWRLAPGGGMQARPHAFA